MTISNYLVKRAITCLEDYEMQEEKRNRSLQEICLKLPIIFDTLNLFKIVDCEGFIVNFGQTFFSQTHYFRALEALGGGTFGVTLKVIKISKLNPQDPVEFVALKINRLKESKPNILSEAKILKEINALEKINSSSSTVLLLDDFEISHSHHALVLELLGERLSKKIPSFLKRCISLNQIKNIALAIFEGLSHLNGLSLIHGDLKPDNILSKDATSSSFKLIDFGLATHYEKLEVYKMDNLMNIFYRPPEIAFKLFPYTQKVDIWSAGILLLKCFFGYHPLVESCQQEIIDNTDLICKIIRLFGPPPESLFKNSSLLHYSSIINKTNQAQQSQLNLKDLIEEASFMDDIEQLKMFGDLILKILKWNPEERPSPQEILRHPFLNH